MPGATKTTTTNPYYGATSTVISNDHITTTRGTFSTSTGAPDLLYEQFHFTQDTATPKVLMNEHAAATFLDGSTYLYQTTVNDHHETSITSRSSDTGTNRVISITNDEHRTVVTVVHPLDGHNTVVHTSYFTV